MVSVSNGRCTIIVSKVPNRRCTARLQYGEVAEQLFRRVLVSACHAIIGRKCGLRMWRQRAHLEVGGQPQHPFLSTLILRAPSLLYVASLPHDSCEQLILPLLDAGCLSALILNTGRVHNCPLRLLQQPAACSEPHCCADYSTLGKETQDSRPSFHPSTYLVTMFRALRPSQHLCVRASSLSQSPILFPRPSLLSSRRLRMASTLPNLHLFQSIAQHDPESIAVIHSVSGRKFTYGELLSDVAKAKDALHEASGKDSIDGERVAFLVENSYDYVGVSPRSHPSIRSSD